LFYHPVASWFEVDSHPLLRGKVDIEGATPGARFDNDIIVCEAHQLQALSYHIFICIKLI
jgi:hypothetical protein